MSETEVSYTLRCEACGMPLDGHEGEVASIPGLCDSYVPLTPAIRATRRRRAELDALRTDPEEYFAGVYRSLEPFDGDGLTTPPHGDGDPTEGRQR